MTTTVPLNPLATYDPTARLNHTFLNTCLRGVTLVVLAISFIALRALSIVAGALMYVITPIHLKLVTALAFVPILFGLYKFEKIFAGKWNGYKEDKDKKIHKIALKIAKQNVNHILETDLGFSSTASDSVKKNLLARYFYYEKLVDHYRKKDTDEIFKKMQDRIPRNRALFSLAAIAHLKAAYCLYLIQKPEDTRKFEDFVGITPKVPLIANAAGKAFSREEILTTSAPKLSSQIFGLQRNWSLFGRR